MTYLDIAINILKKINSLGYEAYIIGGFVRDYLLHMESNDIDITTSMPLDEIKKHFNVIDNGSLYSSLTINYNDNLYEITEFRKDIKYLDNRHPIIEPCNTLFEDVVRRDFTINQLAFDSNLKLYDHFNGMKDLNDKVIRSINDPKVRFQEDSLRILRGLYFSSKLNFDIENKTLNAMISSKNLLKNLSNERIYSYFIKIVYAKYDKGIKYIINNDLFSNILEYKKWIEIADKKYNESSLKYLYSYIYKKLPPIFNKHEKKLCEILIILKNNNFSNYYLFVYKEYIDEFKEILDNYNEILIRINNFKIKNDKDLALSKKEIADYFIGNEKSEKIKEIIENILNEKIKNTKDDIIKYILGVKNNE